MITKRPNCGSGERLNQKDPDEEWWIRYQW